MIIFIFAKNNIDMVEIENLQIGNILRGEKGNICIVNSIDYSDKSINGNSVDSYSYISITDEFLIYNGFEKEEYISRHFIYKKEFELSKMNEKNGYRFFIEDERGNNDIDIDIIYIHQLQNVYKSLKGSSFPIKF